MQGFPPVLGGINSERAGNKRERTPDQFPTLTPCPACGFVAAPQPIAPMHTDAKLTLGAAFLAGLQPHARCLRGKRMGPVKVEPCGYHAALDLECLIWTRGAQFPCWRLASRLKCPRCGGTALDLAWWPGEAPAARARRDLYQCVMAVEARRTAGR